ncbi:SMP-30/gluconolactonase/LRE family protein [Bacteroidota bacterium]
MLEKKISRILTSVMILSLSVLFLSQCTSKPEWYQVNQQLIKQYDIKVRDRSDIPNTGITSNLDQGKVTSIETLPQTELYPGVTAKLYWGAQNLISVMEMEPNAEIPEEVLPADRFLFVLEGEVQQLIDGEFKTLIARAREVQDGTHAAVPRSDFVYLLKGVKSALKTGEKGARLMEVYSPGRSDYMEKAGSETAGIMITDLDYPVKPNVKPGSIYDLYDFQYTELVPGANARIVTGRGAQISFLTMDPGSEFAHHNHPEEQVMMVLRGGINEIILDGQHMMNKGDLVYLPGGMVHGGDIAPEGCDVIDVFGPPRPDYDASMQARLETYHAVIPEETSLELIIDGSVSSPNLYFTEGPCWLNGKLYFSNMYFDQSWAGDPGKSSVIEMDADGSYRKIAKGMQMNGLAALENGNLAVCDMFGHRVIEMTTKGKVVKVLASSYDGKSLDGPNDLVVDAKGGIYFTDPQFTPDAEKNQPGRCVYYLAPGGKPVRVIEPNVFAMPNGVILSPDGKTLYVNNTYDDEAWWNVDSDKDNNIWAYDVNEDGTLGEGRQFARLFLTEDVLDRKGKSTSADGMAIDEMGNLYVATFAGVQIVNANGEFVGIINTPTFPVSCCFGDEDLNTLYITSYSQIYRIATNMKGFIQHQ